MIRKSPATPPVLLWFRNDLRIGDNPALHAAAATGQPLLCLFLLDEETPGLRPLGGAARWWLHHALDDLGRTLAACGGKLHLLRGAALPLLDAIVAETGATACFWNRRYGGAERAADAAITTALEARGTKVQNFNGSLLHEPREVSPATGGAYKVFTPFRRASLALGPPPPPLPAPRKLTAAPVAAALPGETSLAALALLPRRPDWAGGLRETWTPGEQEAQRLLHAFLETGLPRYAVERNEPSLPGTSRLSPFLRHGEISPRQILARAEHAAAAGQVDRKEADKFISEVIWRDFAYNLLLAHPDLASRPVQPAFEAFAYRDPAEAELASWQQGRTGYPIVDAGMRQLWTTGVMHNRVRMITASFLIKHMLVDWRIGEAWFWDTLCDADPASNATNWQWVAGCGADPAPYFRIFNPVLQGETYDPDGTYVRAFVPELGALPARWIHRPWEAPEAVIATAGVALGATYPHPIVEHGHARQRALAAFQAMRGARRAPAEGR